MSGKRAKQGRRGRDRAVIELLHGFVVELRRILRRRSPDYYRRFPDARRPCHTCAFNPATDSWKGAENTAFALQKAIAADEPFYCHEPFERTADGWKFDREKAVLCGGYAAVVGDPDTKRAFVRSIRPGLTDAQADEVSGYVAERVCEIPS
jgi:hypothetical protein